MNINATLIIQIVVFIILWWFTARFVWPPITKALDERSRRIADGLAAADRAKADLAAAELRVQEEIKNARAGAAELRTAAERQAAVLMEQARADASRIVAEARKAAEEQAAQERATREALEARLAALENQSAVQTPTGNLKPRAEDFEDAFKYDGKVLVEKAVAAREIEVAVLEINGELIASVPGEIKIDPKFEFYDFEAKYLDDATTVIAPAELPLEKSEEIKSFALKAFRALGCSGLARVDFFYTNDGQIFINELNTMPGFTSTSVYPKLMSKIGITYQQIITELINGAKNSR